MMKLTGISQSGAGVSIEPATKINKPIPRLASFHGRKYSPDGYKKCNVSSENALETPVDCRSLTAVKSESPIAWTTMQDLPCDNPL